ncbi:MAG: hypothetical protein CVV59_01485 [Tenericutes bacterium HGW-Tenericutes-4]|nr:MAG: hypothetical protein CVV59_01485 [Tenericutes bacterium HGW-Tenericutes-4]
MKNYIETLNINSEKNKTKVQLTLNYYNDQKWWLSSDIKTRAYGQLFEPILVIDFDDMVNGISEILKRQVFEQDLRFSLGFLQTQTTKILSEQLNENSPDLVC